MDHVMDDYNKADFFITPDRKCEQFLFQRGVRFTATIKGETGWTYWIYPRTDTLKQAIDDYVAYLAHRRTMARLWTGARLVPDTEVVI
jgi:hypothetical protein